MAMGEKEPLLPHLLHSTVGEEGAFSAILKIGFLKT
jgi:hypothetical protein